jgi:uncharacterized membrane protein YcgQ (UPF0703/DUF1980 family)
MKKYLLVICLLLAMLSSACAGNTDAATNEAAGEEDISLGKPAMGYDLEIKEKMFIAQVTDIELNASSYEGKVVKVEGMYFGYFDSYSDRDYNYVQRRSPGCCGNDGIVGFEFVFEGDMPENNDWIEVIGKVELFTVEDRERVRLHAEKLTVKDERGAEFVIN